MAMNKAALKTSLESFLSDKDKTPSEAAQGLADVIDAYIRTAVVSTTITGTSPSGPVTGTGSGSLS